MPSLIELGTLTDLDVLAAEMKRRIEARGFAEPKAFLKMAEQILVDHPSSRALVLPAGTVIDGDLFLDYDGLDSRIGTIAALGDLEVKGRIVNADSDGGPFFLADGNVTARQIVMGGASFVVLGSVMSAGVVFCDYNHGTFLVGGNVNAPAVITNDHMIEVAGAISGLVIGDEEGNMRDMLVPDVFEDPNDSDDQWPDGDLMRERLTAGLPVLKNAV